MPNKFRKVLVADERYESAGVFDVDGDGVLDIVSGAYWYQGPDYKARCEIGEVMAEGVMLEDFDLAPEIAERVESGEPLRIYVRVIVCLVTPRHSIIPVPKQGAAGCSVWFVRTTLPETRSTALRGNVHKSMAEGTISG